MKFTGYKRGKDGLFYKLVEYPLCRELEDTGKNTCTETIIRSASGKFLKVIRTRAAIAQLGRKK